VLRRDRPVPVPPAPVGYRRQRPGVAALGRYLPHHAVAFTRRPPHVGEAKKAKRGAVRVRVSAALRPRGAEVDEARLVGMERELVPRKSNPWIATKGFRSFYTVILLFRACPHATLLAP
jgi:hypothetical protein